MKSWMAERDRLLAQANSLVSNVSSARTPPHSDKPHERPLTPQPRPVSSTTHSTIAHSPNAAPMKTRPASEGEADHPPLTFRRHLKSEAQPSGTIAIPMLAGNDRDDVEIRVARFRERQTRLALEREAYCEQVQNDIRGKLRGGSET